MASVTTVAKAQKDQGACEKCGTEIKRGDSYKWIKPRTHRGSTGWKRVRCATCPTWNRWEYSDSLSANCERIAYEFGQEIAVATSPDDVTAALSNAAEQVRELAEGKREGAQNIVDGFGHDTFQSDELNETAEALDSWADEIENADVPECEDHHCEAHDQEPDDCSECQMIREETEQDDALCADHETDPEDCADCADAWHEAVESDLSVVEECPV